MPPFPHARDSGDSVALDYYTLRALFEMGAGAHTEAQELRASDIVVSAHAALLPKLASLTVAAAVFPSDDAEHFALDGNRCRIG